MNKIKVGDTVRILDNSEHPYLTKDKLAIVERIEEDDIGEELLVKELEEPVANKSWWINITSVEKVSSETNTVEEKKERKMNDGLMCVYHCDICGKGEDEVGDLISGRTQVGRDFQVCRNCIEKNELRTNNDVGLLIANKELYEIEKTKDRLELEINVYTSENKPLEKK